MHQVVSSGNVSSTADTSPWPAIILLCVGQVMVILDGTIVNLALTMVQRNPGFRNRGSPG